VKLFHANGAPVLGATMLSAGGGGGAAGGNGDGNGGGEGDPPGDDDGDEGDDLAAIREALKKERQARKAAERELKPLKTQAQQKSEADKTEAQKAADRADAAEKRAQALEGNLRQTRVERAVREADRTLGIGLHDSDLVADLLDLDPDEDFDDKGKPVAKKVEAAVKKLVALRPYLAGAGAQQRRPGGGDGGNGGSNSGGGADMNTMLRRAAGRA
jgi:hypothetical protein